MSRAPSVAKQSKAKLRVEEVLSAAEALLIRDGAEGLSVRSVAKEVGISVGNLQYYFPTRALLFDAVFQRYVATFASDLESVVLTADAPRANFERLFDYWLATEFQPEQGLFWQLWAISAHDEHARATMRRVYDGLIAKMAQLLRELHPELRPTAATLRAATITALIEGSGIFVGFGREPDETMSGLHGEIRMVALEIVDRPPDLLQPGERSVARRRG